MNIKFYCRRAKTAKNGLAKVEVSINQDGERSIITTDLKYSPEKFGKDKYSREYQDAVTTQLNNILLGCIQRGKKPTTALIIDVYRNGWEEDRPYTIKDLWKDYTEEMELKDRANQLTLLNRAKYERSWEAFTQIVPETTLIKDVNKATIERYSLYLATKGYKSTTIGQYLAKVKTVFLFALNNGKIDHNVFYGIKIKKSEVKEDKFLTEEELQTIENKKFEIERLEKVADLFIFAANTGLSFIDLKNLNPAKDIVNEVLSKRRGKTNILYQIPILPKAQEILDKYNGNLPVLSNVKYNAYLKEIQHICGIKKNLTTHTARHSYATRLLNHGVSLEVVSRALGHSSTNITKHYARLLDKTVVNEIRNKMAG